MKKKGQTEQQNNIIHQSKSLTYSGPIPDPDSLARYNSIVPGSADRIIKMAENEASHRHKTENRFSIMYIISTILGIFFAFFSVCIISYLVYYSISNGFGKTASCIAVGAIASVASVFIFFRKTSKK